MEKKYCLDTFENKEYMNAGAKALLEFGKQFPSPGGGSYYLGDDGTPWKDRNRETWITSRMAHVYSMGSLMGYDWCKPLAQAAVKGLKGELHDDVSGGWYAGLTSDGTVVEGKQCYAHAFVILAASSAYLAGVDGAMELLKDALDIYDRYFWDDRIGLSCDGWDTAFTKCDDYRGLNANMHTVEAFLAVADALEDDKYRKRAGRIIDHVAEWAQAFDHRIPEHFDVSWVPQPQMNKERPDDPFKPYGATPGHGIEWSRLISQWAVSTFDPSDKKREEYIILARKLYERAITDAWNADGAPGIVYTTDWDGSPVVHDRMHWTLAEAINTSAVLYRITADPKYKEDLSAYLSYLDETVLDHSCGSWFHQLDRTNKPMDTVWPGKADLYHAFQAMLIPYSDISLSICKSVFEGK